MKKISVKLLAELLIQGDFIIDEERGYNFMVINSKSSEFKSEEYSTVKALSESNVVKRKGKDFAGFKDGSWYLN